MKKKNLYSKQKNSDKRYWMPCYYSISFSDYNFLRMINYGGTRILGYFRLHCYSVIIHSY